VLVIVALFFLNIPAQYGGDSYTLQTGPDVSGARFFASSTEGGVTCLYEFSLLQRYFEPSKNVSFRTLQALPYTYVPNSSEVLSVAGQVDYVLLSRTQNNYYYYFMQQNPLMEVMGERGGSDPDFGCVYDNGAFAVFERG
jgi:hypothetical protein